MEEVYDTQLLDYQYNLVNMYMMACDLSHYIPRLNHKFQGKDHGIYCLHMLYFCHSLSWLRTPVCMQCKDLQSIPANIYTNQLHCVLCI